MRIFVACPYSPLPLPNYVEIFRAVELSMERRNAYPVKFRFSNEVVANDHLLDKITADIRECQSCFFDITGLNANVCIEFGLARGMEKDWRLLCKLPTGLFGSRSELSDAMLPADLRGQDRLHYTEETLKTGLEDLVTHVVADWKPQDGHYNFNALCTNILKLISRNSGLTSSEIASAQHLETENISSALKKLERDGKLERSFKGPNGRYYLYGQVPEFGPQAG